jgi:predicted short-subunit dehydrogenase-like oxidoreductase (DUF2520 family)
MRKISNIGVGRLGGALAVALSGKGYEIENLIVRSRATAARISEIIEPEPAIYDFENPPPITSEIIFITTQDFEIEGVAEQLAKQIGARKPLVFHASGSLSSEILEPLEKKGCATGSIHPLVSLSDAVLGAERFKDAYFCVEGAEQSVAAARRIVADLGGKSFSIETKYKTLYHAAAVTACGHLVAVVDVAIEMLKKCGLNDAAAKETLLPLIKSTIDNLEIQAPAEALTGTFARADYQTFEKHLAAFEESISDEAREIYLQLGARALHLAEEQGADKANIGKIRDKISLAKKNFKC